MRGQSSPELAAELFSTSLLAAGFALGAQGVWHYCGPVSCAPAIIGSLCLEISGPRMENELAGLQAKLPGGVAESNLSVLMCSVHT